MLAKGCDEVDPDMQGFAVQLASESDERFLYWYLSQLIYLVVFLSHVRIGE